MRGYIASTALLNSTSNTLAGATALKLDITGTNTLASAALVTTTSNTLAAATLAITNGLPTTAITNGMETVTAANTLSNTLAGATALKLDITGTNLLASTALVSSTSNTLAGATALKLDITGTNTLASTALVTGTSNTLVSGYTTADSSLSNALVAAISTKEPAITSGSTTQYWRGDKTWQPLNQAAVAGLRTDDSPTFSNLTVTAYLSGANKTAFLEVKFGAGNGGDANFSFSSDFTTVNFASLDSYTVTDNGGNWSSANNWYTCPVSGVYRVMTKLRVTDGEGSPTSYGQGADTSNGDSPTFAWFQTYANRNSSLNIRVSHFTQGEQIRMFAYADDFLDASDGSMTIELLYKD